MAHMNESICTYTGIEIFPFDPTPEMISIEDIAQGLANTCRYSGQCHHFFSVAQHSIYVSYLCKPENALKGLLHDASEAYFTDIPKPIKHRFGDYEEHEDRLLEVIYKRFGLDTTELKPDDVEWADKHIYKVERINLMPDVEWYESPPVDTNIDFNPWVWTWAKFKFLQRFKELYGEME